MTLHSQLINPTRAAPAQNLVSHNKRNLSRFPVSSLQLDESATRNRQIKFGQKLTKMQVQTTHRESTKNHVSRDNRPPNDISPRNGIICTACEKRSRVDPVINYYSVNNFDAPRRPRVNIASEHECASA